MQLFLKKSTWLALYWFVAAFQSCDFKEVKTTNSTKNRLVLSVSTVFVLCNRFFSHISQLCVHVIKHSAGEPQDESLQ